MSNMQNYRALIPFRPINPKTRLSSVLSQEEREEFAQIMLDDVIKVAKDVGFDVTVLSTSPYESKMAEVVVRDEGLNEALNHVLPTLNVPVLIIMSDLPIVRAIDLERVLATEKDIAIVPGLGGGTNILFIRNPQKYHVEYYGFSFKKHCDIAKEAGMTIDVIDSMRMSMDVDEPSDLVELLIHGTGRSPGWLLSHNFSLSTESGRLKVTYKGEEIV